ncbi:24770_t:CDS:1 [Dentiscutata erythropus]|uniref:24770_t:CDS:1 n=1 Tax=Dentiscutata erythropus TaxID=1348616 RepID=A0A9N9HN09_9GLOM|nr:24770_t:CDS:1 [Dentiscutata erythropus]
MHKNYCFIVEPSIPGVKVDPYLRELQKKARSLATVEPLLIVEFPPSIDEYAFIKHRKSGHPYPTKAPNPFFFYRKEYVLQLKKLGRQYPMTDISGHVSRSWKNESDHIKDYYKELSRKASELMEKYKTNSLPARKQLSKKKSSRPSNKPNRKVHTPQPSALIDTPIMPQPETFINTEYSEVNYFNPVIYNNELYYFEQSCDGYFPNNPNFHDLMCSIP